MQTFMVMSERDEANSIIEALDFELDPAFRPNLGDMKHREAEMRLGDIESKIPKLVTTWFERHRRLASSMIAIGLVSGAITGEHELGERWAKHINGHHLDLAEGYEKCQKLVQENSNIAPYKQLKLGYSSITPSQLQDCGFKETPASLSTTTPGEFTELGGEISPLGTDGKVKLPSEDSLTIAKYSEEQDATELHLDVKAESSLGGMAVAGLLLSGIGYVLNRRTLKRREIEYSYETK